MYPTAVGRRCSSAAELQRRCSSTVPRWNAAPACPPPRVAGGQSTTSNPIANYPHAKAGTPYYVNSTATHPPPSSSVGAEEGKSRQPKRVVLRYQEEQARVLSAALLHVKTLGWSEAAMIAGAMEVCLSLVLLGSFPRKGAALVEYSMDDCFHRLIDMIDSGEDLNGLIPSECVSKLIRLRLEMQAPFISKWTEALAVQYVKRTVLGGIYSRTEVYMLTDSSLGIVFSRNRWCWSGQFFAGIL